MNVFLFLLLMRYNCLSCCYSSQNMCVITIFQSEIGNINEATVLNEVAGISGRKSVEWI